MDRIPTEIAGVTGLTNAGRLLEVGTANYTIQESLLKDAVSGTNTLSFGGALTGDRTVTFPDADVTIVVAPVGGSAQLTNAGKHVISDGDGTISESAHLTESTNGVTSVGGWVRNTERKTTTYTATVADEVLFCNTNGAAWTLTLPAGVDGQHFKIINCGSSNNDLTVDPDGTEQLFGAGAGVAATVSDGEIIDIDYNATEGWW